MEFRFGTKRLAKQHIAGIRTTTTMDKIGEVMGPLFGEVFGHIQQSGQLPAGMPFALYHSMDGNSVDLECGIPVSSPIPGTDRVKAGELLAPSRIGFRHRGLSLQARHGRSM